jgi:hypothetical protein
MMIRIKSPALSSAELRCSSFQLLEMMEYHRSTQRGRGFAAKPGSVSGFRPKTRVKVREDHSARGSVAGKDQDVKQYLTII